MKIAIRTVLIPVLAFSSGCGGGSSNDTPGPANSMFRSNSSDWVFHDPSRIVLSDGKLWVAITGKEQVDGYDCGLELWSLSPGDELWQPESCLLREKPAWVAEELPTNDGAFWAPDFLNEETIYYSVSSGFDDENERTCLGLIRMEDTGEGPQWRDSGRPITCSHNALGQGQSVIDPAAFVDDSGGVLSTFLVFGGGRILLAPTDPETGGPLAGEWWIDDDVVPLATGPRTLPDGNPIADPQWIEAAFMLKRHGYYYLFVNWYGCCNGVDSTYEIRIGRSPSLYAPFVDASGELMMEGGGTLLHHSDSGEYGPGQAGVLAIEAEGEAFDVLSYHYYTENGDPWATLGTRKLHWVDHWPVIDNEPFDLSSWLSRQHNSGVLSTGD